MAREAAFSNRSLDGGGRGAALEPSPHWGGVQLLPSRLSQAISFSLAARVFRFGTCRPVIRRTCPVPLSRSVSV